MAPESGSSSNASPATTNRSSAFVSATPVHSCTCTWKVLWLSTRTVTEVSDGEACRYHQEPASQFTALSVIFTKVVAGEEVTVTGGTLPCPDRSVGVTAT